MDRENNTEYVLSLSYGKDSLACLGAIQELGWPLDRIVTVEVWATDTIPADLPPMMEFKKKADAIIKERFGIEVEHVCATRTVAAERERESTQDSAPLLEKLTYEKMFYHVPKRRGTSALGESLKMGGAITGFPTPGTPWCNGNLKLRPLQRISSHKRELVQETQIRELSTGSRSQSAEGIGVQVSRLVFSDGASAQGAKINTVQYLGIAADEPERILRHSTPDKALPLVEIGWDEAYCRKWCEENDLLSPIYTDSTRGGCWFCHNQGVDQLRKLRKNYPEYWKILLKWDLDSPITFKADGHTVHDFDKRFAAEDAGFFQEGKRFLWKQLDDFQYP